MGNRGYEGGRRCEGERVGAKQTKLDSFVVLVFSLVVCFFIRVYEIFFFGFLLYLICLGVSQPFSLFCSFFLSFFLFCVICS